MQYADLAELNKSIAHHVLVVDGPTGGRIEITDAEAFRKNDIDRLVYSSVFGNDEVRTTSRWLIWEASRLLGAIPSSIDSLYAAAGRGEYSHSTVPAMNLRGMTYDVARCIFRVAMRNNSKAFIFEIARSEMDYTDQTPAEFSSAVLAAAIREGYKGPVFIQGDHFQMNAKAYAENPGKEMEQLKALTRRAIEAGFYNIDIDTSTLVDLAKPTVEEQQRPNFHCAADMAKFIRAIEPAGITVSVGGEIGEVGGKNSTVEELKAFMRGFTIELGPDKNGLSKLSVQTGTVHGGVVLPDGTMAMVDLDFDVLRDLSAAATKEYGMAGAVQHGASTLPEAAFHRFTEVGTAEVHLATGFQNIVFDNQAFPADLKHRMYAHLKETRAAADWKKGMSDDQFYYTTRKRAWGP
ncbi:MAG: class II fructose-bisphosphate aldolase, partial [Dehalococcoidia bacterium]|nr:class II fructose-bisphosphate aldolase [Dehalococcoidia bacterium]